MSFYDLIMKRRSVRDFEDQKVPQKIIDELLDVANNAPSGGNIQPLSVIVIQEEEARAQLSKLLNGQPWIKKAPLSIIFCIDFYRVKKWASLSDTNFLGDNAILHFLIAYADVMCAAQTVVISAESYGLGSVYAGVVLTSITKVRQYFTIPKYVLPVMVLSIGYPRSVPNFICKLDKSFVIHQEKYKVPRDEDILEAYNTKYRAFFKSVDDYFQCAYVEAIEHDKQSKANMIQSIKDRIQQFGIKNPAQFLFDLRYPSKATVALNKKLFREFKKAGFEFI